MSGITVAKRRSDVRILVLALLFLAHLFSSVCNADVAEAATGTGTSAAAAFTPGMSADDTAERRHQCELGAGIGISVDKRGVVKIFALTALGLTAVGLLWGGPPRYATLSPPPPHAVARGGTRLLRTLCVQRV
ncbi:hypothetical protein [Marinactinospora rubrisoli]|uniref:Uncharacterized protein n=1 Tax=Marinactinospora rubrisoli TaxID=2715399 RepID=A0ABW2KCV0_9ACTN